MHALPNELAATPFTRAMAKALGIPPRLLRPPHVRVVHRGVYVASSMPNDLPVLVGADALVLPGDAVLSHTTALAWWGLVLRPESPRHYSTNGSGQTRSPAIVLHRRKAELFAEVVRGRRVTRPDRTLVDCASILSPRELVRAGDWMIRQGLTDQETVRDFVEQRHYNGVVTTRRAALHLRERVDSVRETDLRLLLTTSGLPEPEVNTDILAADGSFLARGDLVLRRWRIVIEYDGAHHQADPAQWQKDIGRRERLHAAGWTMVTVTNADMQHPATVIARVWEALIRAGYQGPAPRFNPAAWHTLRGL